MLLFHCHQSFDSSSDSWLRRYEWRMCDYSIILSYLLTSLLIAIENEPYAVYFSWCVTCVDEYAGGESERHGRWRRLPPPHVLPRRQVHCLRVRCQQQACQLQRRQHGAQRQEQADQVGHVTLVRAQKIALVQHLHLPQNTKLTPLIEHGVLHKELA